MSECNGCPVCKVYQGGECIKGNDFSETNRQSKIAFDDPETLKMLKVSAEIESGHYMQWNRLEELIGFFQKMDYQKIGVANCVGFAKETALLAKILSQHFKVFTICCKNGGLNKDDYGMPHIKPERYEATCNPVGQALILGEHKTDANIILGLCIGHDMIFNQHSEAPVTTFAVKDRVLAHNPMGALYSGYSLRKVLKK
ncbi:DUF1847 domain-containing protein [uncultured Desulfuromusa sp.]|uniref:DUF1847 domain-containing protein n=1 Tax=uncultured Desulfuromusa sp. TaxID=219183 RepID=UPI002AA61DA1|nr:DUF1847 domain-containing protein [uncultured Desulfuromusa sp.]